MKEVCALDKKNTVSKGPRFGCYIPSNALIYSVAVLYKQFQMEKVEKSYMTSRHINSQR